MSKALKQAYLQHFLLVNSSYLFSQIDSILSVRLSRINRNCSKDWRNQLGSMQQIILCSQEILEKKMGKDQIAIFIFISSAFIYIIDRNFLLGISDREIRIQLGFVSFITNPLSFAGKNLRVSFVWCIDRQFLTNLCEGSLKVGHGLALFLGIRLERYLENISIYLKTS